MFDPQHFNIVRSVAEMVGGALLLWFVVMFVTFWIQARAQETTRARLRRK